MDYSSIHELLPNECIHNVAETCSVTTTALQAANPQIPDINNVAAGLLVCVPSSCCSQLACTNSSLALAPSPSAPVAAAGEMSRVPGKLSRLHAVETFCLTSFGCSVKASCACGAKIVCMHAQYAVSAEHAVTIHAVCMSQL